MERHPHLAALLAKRGTIARIATACGVAHSAVSQWQTVPKKHLHTVADLLDVPVDQLIPRGEREAQS